MIPNSDINVLGTVHAGFAALSYPQLSMYSTDNK